jgi:type I restriction enzyme S subunit
VYDAINKPTLEKVEFLVPKLLEQETIGSVLCSYDDLIENNEKRIKALQEMASRLYTEWFVKFKFPGHEKVKLVESGTEFGMIPEGWKVKRLGDIADFTMGQSPESKYYNQDGEGLPFHQGVADFEAFIPANRVYSTQGNKHAKAGDILFSVRAPVGEINFCLEEIILGRGLCAFRHKQNHQWFLLALLKNKFTEKDLIGNGAIYKSVNRMEIENLKFVVPSRVLEEKYEDGAGSLFGEVLNLYKRNRTLSRTRDLLIPQLVTGKREVK